MTRYKCGFCPKSWTSKKTRDIHEGKCEKLTNEDRGLISCSECGLGFPDERAIHMHGAQLHNIQIDENTLMRYIRELKDEKIQDKKSLGKTFGRNKRK